MGWEKVSEDPGRILDIGCDTIGGDQNSLVNWAGDSGCIWCVKEQTQMQRSRLTWPDLREDNEKCGLVERLNEVKQGPCDSFLY